EDSPYLAFIVALHVATALSLILFYWRDWVRIVTALITTLRTRRIETSTERLAWLLVIATVPVGLTGLALEHTFRTLFAKPLAAPIFLTINGLILFGAEQLRKRAEQAPAADATVALVGVGASASTAGDPVAAGSGRHAAGPVPAAVPGRRQLETL